MNKNKKHASDLTLDEKISLLSGNNVWHTKEIKKIGLKALTLRDGPHGVRDGEPAIAYPNLCLAACSWDRQILYKLGQYLGDDAKEHGIDVLLAPGVNIKRTPTAGRNFEYFSEDPLLTGELAAEFVKGIQSRGVAACVKHFVCNDRENKRFSYNVTVDEKTLREIYLKPFEIVIKKAKPKCIMSAYNFVNGQFACQNHMLYDVLRNEFLFSGTVMSDWGGTDKRKNFYNAGGNLEMPGSDEKTHDDVKLAVLNGELSEDKINESAEKIIELADFCSCSAKPKIAKDIASLAAESFVLLENNGILPIGKDEKIALTGDALQASVFCGGGCANVSGKGANTLLSELSQYFCNADFVEKPSEKLNSYNAVIVFLREKESSEGFDRKDLSVDCSLLKQVALYNKNIITVLINGSVILLNQVKQYSAAVIESYYAGQALGKALPLALTGAVVPSGRLAETFLSKESDSYAYGEEDDEDIFYAERTSVGYRYYAEKAIKTQYAFGYGLSYSRFTYCDFYADKSFLDEGTEGVNVYVTLKNDGVFDAKEVVQIYLHTDGKNGDPIVKLVAFDKVFVKKGQILKTKLFIAASEFMRYDVKKQKYVFYGGKVKLSVNSDAQSVLLTTDITLKPYLKADRYTTVGEIINKQNGAELVVKHLKKAIIGCIIGDDDNYPFSVKNGHIAGEEFFSRVAESLQLRQLVSMSNNKLSEQELDQIIAILNEE